MVLRSLGANQRVPSAAFGIGVTLPAPDCSSTVPCRTTNASPLLKAATATVFGKDCGTDGRSREAMALGSANEIQTSHAIERERHITSPGPKFGLRGCERMRKSQLELGASF